MTPYLVRYKKRIAAGAVVLLLAILVFSFSGGDKTPTSQKDFPIDIPNVGGIIPLQDAMKDNKILRQRVEQLLDYDAAYLFVNDRQINNEIAYILFLWADFTPEQVEQMGAARAVEGFLRAYHGLPDDFTIKNSPLLGARPWPRIFNIMKARLLMLGQGHKIYQGTSYYNSLTDRMEISGMLSPEFVNGFAAFLEQQPANTRTRLKNNFLIFVDSTKGLNNLNDAEQNLIKTLDD